MFDKRGSTKTLIAIQSGGAGCGNLRFKDAPKWWMRVNKEHIHFYHNLCNLRMIAVMTYTNSNTVAR